jgi:hypothetical protein
MQPMTQGATESLKAVHIDRYEFDSNVRSPFWVMPVLCGNFWFAES